jgi:hypothetical protein
VREWRISSEEMPPVRDKMMAPVREKMMALEP